MLFGLLGPVEVIDGDRPLRVPEGRQRSVLVLLLLHRNEPVSSDRLIDALWGEAPPPTAAKVLQNYVGSLRRALGDREGSRLQTHGRGYALQVADGELDIDRFEGLVRGGGEALAQRRPAAAADLLREALALWRGPPLVDVAYDGFAQGEIARLEERRLVALEWRIDADLALGRHADLVPELQALVAQHPLRERLHAQRMLALYRCGRQAEALQAFREARRLLVEEVGVEPGARLRDLHEAILRQDPSLEPEPADAPSRAADATAASSSGAQALPSGTVTFLFTDVEGSTELLRRLGRRYAGALEKHLEVLRAATAAHGGREIDTQGDAFFAGFVRATDAVEAAVQAQHALEAHAWPEGAKLRVRMGLHTGEPPAAKERFVGLGVHRAARICAAGHGGQVLVSDATHQVLEDDPPHAISFKDLGRHRLKDFTQPQHLFQVLAPGLRTEFPRLRTVRSGRGRHLAIVGAAAATLAAAALGVAQLAARSESASAVAVKADAVGVIDPGSRQLRHEVPVGASPSHVLATPGAVWVSNADGNSVSRINPAKHAVVQTIPVGSGPAGLAYADGAVWVANTLDGTVSRINPATNSEVQLTSVGNDPTGVAAAGGWVWVANSGEQTLSKIDPVSGHQLKKVPVGATPTDLLAADGSLWMSSQRSGSVSQLDPHTGQVEDPIDVSGSPSAMTFAAGSVWAANPLDGTVTRIDPHIGKVIDPITVGNGPDALAAAPGGVWVSNEYAGTLERIDSRRDVITRRIAVGNHPTGLALENGLLWVGARASGAAHRGGTLRIVAGHPYDGGIDPASSSDTLSVPMLQMTNDALLAYQNVGGAAGTRLVPDLAVSIPRPSDGGRTYRFVLRPGIRYSTGAAVRVQDVRASIERLFKMAPVSQPLFFTGLVGAKACSQHPRTCDLSKGIATDPRASTVTFHLTAPDPEFLNKTASWFADVLPAGTPPRQAQTPLPATGPYEIAEYRRGHILRLVRNPRFHEWSQAAQPDGYPDQIVLRSDLTPGAAITAVERNQADDFGGLKDGVIPTRLQELTTRFAGRTHIEPALGVTALFMNTRLPPFNDVRVRRALNYAMDRRVLIGLAGGTAIGTATCQYLPPNFPGYERYCPYQPAQLQKAQRLVDESGTRGVPITVVTPPGVLVPVARYATSTLQRLGYHASMEVLGDVGRYFQTISDSRKHQQIGPVFWGSDYPAASDTFVQLLSCKAFLPGNPNNINWAEFCDPQIDALMRRASAAQATRPELANRRWALVDRRVVHAAPWVPMLDVHAVELVSSRVGNYQFNPENGGLIDQLWVH